MRKVLGWGSDIFWLMVSVGFGLAALLFVLHLIRSHVGGFGGTIAGDIESAITPQG